MGGMNNKQRVSIKIETAEMSACGISDRGRERFENEDAILLEESGFFMLLADGMGGHERGAEASATVIEIIHEYLRPELLLDEIANITETEGIPTDLICLSSLVEEAIRKANSVLYERNQKGGYRRFMGTTVAGLVPAKDDYMLWFHVGDSRVYRCRNSVLKRLTVDHSAHMEWERSGRNGIEPSKHIITRAVGPKRIAIVDIGWEKRLKEDLYLMCSDGLTDMLSDEKILQVMTMGDDVNEVAAELVDAANDAGGRDNISVVVCRV